ncbi:MAG: adenylate/guanylate cyclase domain-containing protein [Candidatus Ozemobacteraceae bacterium]
MGLLDSLLGGPSKAELEAAKREIATLKDHFHKANAEREQLRVSLTKQIDQVHALISRMKGVVGCMVGDQVLDRTWDLLENALAIKKGAIYTKSAAGWKPTLARGFGKEGAPVIPLEEESIATHAAKHGVGLSLAHIRNTDDLKYLERRGIISDIKLAAPIRIQGQVQGILLICIYGGNVFSGEDDLELVQMVSSLLGLVIQNTLIFQEKNSALAKKTEELDQKSQELSQKEKELGRVRNLFSQMVSPEVIQAIEANPEGIVLGGSRQRIAIFFADVRGFTRLAEQMSPEKVVDLLNLYFANLTEIILKHRGTLDKFMGDGAMALFGTPVPIENPCQAAVSAAHEIQKMVSQSVKTWVASGFPALSVGIGISFEDVVVGHVGSPRLSNFTAVGDGVNFTSRLCSLALGGEVIVSDSCFAELGEWKDGHDARSGISLKGRSELVTVHSIWIEEKPETLPCPACGQVLSPSGRFCSACGFRGI